MPTCFWCEWSKGSSGQWVTRLRSLRVCCCQKSALASHFLARRIRCFPVLAHRKTPATKLCFVVLKRLTKGVFSLCVGLSLIGPVSATSVWLSFSLRCFKTPSPFWFGGFFFVCSVLMMTKYPLGQSRTPMRQP